MSDWNSDDIKKKECYFEPHTIARRSALFLDSLAPLRKYRDPMPVPDQTALLVLDMQDYFLESDSHAFVPASGAVVPRLAALQDVFLARSRPVIQTRHGNDQQNAAQMSEWWRGVLWDTDPLRRITPALARSEIPVVEKTQYDAFYNTDLQERLHRLGVTSLVVGGVMTHLCCETTARAAFVRGFRVYFLIDGTATYNSLLHIGTLRALGHGFAVPVLCAEVMDAMKSGK